MDTEVMAEDTVVMAVMVVNIKIKKKIKNNQKINIFNFFHISGFPGYGGYGRGFGYYG